jgi:hypothetical protein
MEAFFDLMLVTFGLLLIAAVASLGKRHER